MATTLDNYAAIQAGSTEFAVGGLAPRHRPRRGRLDGVGRRPPPRRPPPTSRGPRRRRAPRPRPTPTATPAETDGDAGRRAGSPHDRTGPRADDHERGFRTPEARHEDPPRALGDHQGAVERRGRPRLREEPPDPPRSAGRTPPCAGWTRSPRSSRRSATIAREPPGRVRPPTGPRRPDPASKTSDRPTVPTGCTESCLSRRSPNGKSPPSRPSNGSRPSGPGRDGDRADNRVRREEEERVAKVDRDRVTSIARNDTTETKAKYQAVKDKIAQDALAQAKAVEAEYAEAKKAVASEANSARNSAKKKMEEVRWQALAVFEAGKDNSIKQFKIHETEIKGLAEQIEDFKFQAEPVLSASAATPRPRPTRRPAPAGRRRPALAEGRAAAAPPADAAPVESPPRSRSRRCRRRSRRPTNGSARSTRSPARSSSSR